MRHAGRLALLLLLTLLSRGGCVVGSSSPEGLSDEQEQMDGEDGVDEAPTTTPPEEEVCVTLEKRGSGCKGHVESTNVFTALTKPGSPCKHTVHMKDNSAKDQYCDATNGVFHQTVFVHNTHCKVEWDQKAFSPMKLTYKQDQCTYGYKLKSCTPGPCKDASPNNDSSSEKEWAGVEEILQTFGRNALLRGAESS